jgi:hypothetical protein
MNAKRWLLAALSALLLASCQAPTLEFYAGHGGDGEDEAGTGRPRDLLVGRWELVDGGGRGTVTVVQFTSGGAFSRTEQFRGGWAATMAAGGYGTYKVRDDHTLEISAGRGKQKVGLSVTKDELVLTYPGKKPERFRRVGLGGHGGFGGSGRLGSPPARFRDRVAPRASGR